MTTQSEDIPSEHDAISPEDLESIFGGTTVPEQPDDDRKRHFEPWHHPVKQIVRARQWAFLTKKMLRERQVRPRVLRYFTLPGPDLLDVRVLAEVCQPLGIKIDYFGFDDAGRHTGDPVRAATTAESALRQAGRITDEAIILPDRLEDLAIGESQAQAQLAQRAPFDVINIDPCDHLAYSPIGRQTSTFDALRCLLEHQMVSQTQWLLFVTTRAAPDLLGQPGVEFQSAILENLKMASETFGTPLASLLNADQSKLMSALTGIWATLSSDFLKLYCVGLAKYLLHFFHAQPNHPANVELASAYTYRVRGNDPDMLAIAFRITPDARRVFEPAARGAAAFGDLEPRRAVHVIDQVRKLQDLDHALEQEADVRQDAIEGTELLLRSANYDVLAWREWVRTHKERPLAI